MIEKVIFVHVSGGKDSALTLALALDRYKTTTPVVALFCDTGWEHELTYRYIETLEEFFRIRIHRLKGASIPEAIQKATIFPSPRRRFCTSECKTVPTYKFYEHTYFNFPFKTAEVWQGLRRNESQTRRKIEDYTHKAFEKTRFGEWFPFDIKYHYPIKNLTERQVFDELKKRGIPINPLYEIGFRRVGCYPCFLSKKDIRMVVRMALRGCEFSKKRLGEIRELEKITGKKCNVDFSLDELIEKEKKKLRMLELPL